METLLALLLDATATEEGGEGEGAAALEAETAVLLLSVAAEDATAGREGTELLSLKQSPPERVAPQSQGHVSSVSEASQMQLPQLSEGDVVLEA